MPEEDVPAAYVRAFNHVAIMVNLLGTTIVAVTASLNAGLLVSQL